MRKLLLTCLATGTLISAGYAQTLFTYGSKPVTKAEFLRVYQKNAPNKKADFSDSALQDYLKLYSLFRMKVSEAEAMHLDTVRNIQTELDNYRRQLARNYLTDDKMTDKLVKEAYDRMKEEVHVAHILIMAPPTMQPADTLAAYHKIDSIYKAITKNKADFSALAGLYTDDKGTRSSGGDLGYITGLQTVYPFENVVYSTPVGKVSNVFRTQFGYHIVKVLDRRPAKGEIQVSHILVLTPKSKGEEGVELAKRKMDTIKAELKKGVPFAELAKKYSEDKFTADEGGRMQPLTVGKVAPAFENAAFALKNPGDVSEPVQTDYGFHLILLEKKLPLKPYDSLAPMLKRKVDNDSRSQIARDMYIDKIKQKNGFKEYPANLEALIAKVTATVKDTGAAANLFNASDYAGMRDPLFVIGGKPYAQGDLMSFAETLTRGRLMGPKNAVLRDVYAMYMRNEINDFQERQLVNENEDFRNLMEEYRNGIMLFELMDRNVWSKAGKDSTGLKAFYEQHKNKYLWDPGFTGSVYRFKDEAAKNAGMALIKKGLKDEEILKQANSEANPDAVAIQHGRYEFTHFKDVPQTAMAAGKTTEPVKTANGGYVVVRVEQVYNTPTVKSLDEARGYAVAEYQDYLEKEWNQQLRSKYPVKVNNDVFKTMVK